MQLFEPVYNFINVRSAFEDKCDFMKIKKHHNIRTVNQLLRIGDAEQTEILDRGEGWVLAL